MPQKKKKCDNTSVAAIVKDSQNRILLIERKKYNPGFALPAGHEDGDGAEKALIKEIKEEVGLVVNFARPRLMMTLKNPCKREGGSFHRWTVFDVLKWRGKIIKGDEEVRSYVWADNEMIKEFAHRLEEFAEKNKISIDNNHLSDLVKSTNESELWKQSPGLEPPMYVLFKELKII
ncbi:MAG TPA: NUDIX hydrolase [Candidatus Paceibacterota bacterium]